MTIGKKLYKNFGIILSMVVVLFIVNLVAVLTRARREGRGQGLARPGRRYERRALSDDAEPTST